MRKYLILLLTTAFAFAQAPSRLPGLILTSNQPTVTTTPHLTTTESNGLQGRITPANLPISSETQTALSKKQNFSTGLIKNGQISATIGSNVFAISAGIGIVGNYSDPENPIITKVTISARTGVTPAYLTTGLISYIAVDVNDNLIQSSSPFTEAQRRDYILLGAVVHSNLSTINAINNISAPTEASTNQLHDFMEAVGALNLTGNKYSANGANLSLDKSAGKIFKLGVNFNIDWKNPHQLAQSAGTALTFRYRTQNGTEGSDVTVLNPTVYDLSNVLTTVPNNKFTIQTVTMFQSGLTRIQYGQNYYDTMAEAEAAIFTRNYTVEGNIATNGITRAYIIIKKECTSLLNTADAKIIESTKFGGSASGGVALTSAAIISALGYTPADDVNVVHKTGAETVAGTKTFTDRLELSGNTFALRLKETLNNSYVDIVNTSLGSSSLQFKSSYGSGKTLMTLLNKTGTNASQLAVGNVSSIPAESQLYIYGGDNGANIDMRGLTTRDETNMDLEGSDWETSPNSLGFSYFGPNFSTGGTILGYPKIKTGVVRFNNADNALITSSNATGVTPIRFGINDSEVLNIDNNGLNILNGSHGISKADDGLGLSDGNGGMFQLGNFGNTYDKFFFSSKDFDTDLFGSFVMYANAEEGLQVQKTNTAGSTTSLSYNNNSLLTSFSEGGNSSSVEFNPYSHQLYVSDGVSSSYATFRSDGTEFTKPISLLSSTIKIDDEESNFNITDLAGNTLYEFGANSTYSVTETASSLTANRTYAKPNKSGTYALTSDVPITGIFTPTSGGGVTYTKSYYSKVGNILTIHLNGEVSVGSSNLSTSTSFSLPNSYTVASVSNNRTTGASTLGTASNTVVGSVKISENSSDTSILNVNLGGTGLSLTTYYFSAVITVEVN